MSDGNADADKKRGRHTVAIRLEAKHYDLFHEHADSRDLPDGILARQIILEWMRENPGANQRPKPAPPPMRTERKWGG